MATDMFMVYQINDANCYIIRSFWRMAPQNVPKNPAQSRITT